MRRWTRPSRDRWLRLHLLWQGVRLAVGLAVLLVLIALLWQIVLFLARAAAM